MQFLIIRVSNLKHFSLLFAAYLLLSATASVWAQPSSVRISVVPLAPAKVTVQLHNEAGASEWSFRNAYAGIVGLAERVENFRGTNLLGSEVAARKLAPGVFTFPEKVTRVSYDVVLPTPAKLTELSHVSWLNEEYGLLMLGDLLPEIGMGSAPILNLLFVLPSQWVSASSGEESGSSRYVVSRPEEATFVVGRGSSLVRKSAVVAGTQVKIVTLGNWSFSNGDVRKIATKIIDEHSRVLQHPLPADVGVLLLPYREGGAERWSAETRGQNVVLLMGSEGSRTSSLARLKVVLTHELFHLWVPNALRLQGNYDWFFEGFTVYQALLASLRLHYIKFADYLETLGRVYDSYRSSMERDKLSLLEASERRWTTTSPLVYDKGVLVAFIFDLMVRSNSGGQNTMIDIYPELLRAASGGRQDGNELVMRVLNGRHGMERFSEQYVHSRVEIDFASVLAPFGLEVTRMGSSSRIQVSKTLSAEQRQLLKTLGYRG